MSDLAIVLTTNSGNDVVGDLEVVNGDVALTTGVRAAMQDIFLRLRMHLGEWFLNTDEGIPYLTRILTQNPDLGAIRSLFRRAILTVPSVASVDTLTVAFDRRARVLTVNFAGRMVSGIAFTTADYGALTVTV